VHIPLTNIYLYLDVLIVRGQSEILKNGKLDQLVNSVFAVEVLQDSTTDYDRSGKFVHYRTIESVRDYLLIDSRSIRAELYSRAEANQWTFTEILDPADTVMPPSVN
jgi:Uma2 family endonuclease